MNPVLKQAFVLLFLFIGFGLNAQVTDQPWTVGVEFGMPYQYTTNIFQLSEVDGITPNQRKFNFQTGISLNYQAKEKLGLFGSLLYNQRDFSGEYYCITCDLGTDTKIERFSFRLIEVPLGAKYYLINHPFKAYGAASLNPSWKWGKTHSPFFKNSDINRFYLGWSLGVGVDFAIREKYSFSFSNWLVGSESFDKDIAQIKQSFFRIQLGFHYRLNYKSKQAFLSKNHAKYLTGL